MLTTLIYRSRLCDTVPFREIEDMVARANLRNGHASVTGILLFNGLHFFQMLEGPEESVKIIYQQICKDSYHYNIVELMCDYAPFRRFGKSGMELFDLRRYEQGDVLQAVLNKGTTRYQLTYNDRALNFLRTFVLTSGKESYYEIPPADSWHFKADERSDNETRRLSVLTEHVYFQPLVDPLSRKIISLEIRNSSPEFLTIDTVTGSDECYLADLKGKQTAFATGGHLLEKNGILSVSLMPMTLVKVPGAVDFLLTEIAANNLIPEQVVIRFTENEVISQFDVFADAVKGLKAAGISIGIDHFGSGFAGLQLLARFQPDRIKISRDLITEVHKNGPRQAIILAIIKCCSSLEIQISVDGVELQEEWMWLESVGIEHFQGPLFSIPEYGRVPTITWPEKMNDAEI